MQRETYRREKQEVVHQLAATTLRSLRTNKTLSQGARAVVAVMQRDERRFKDTGGWGFEAFKGGDPNQRLVTDASKQCFGCHAPHSDNNYLFTRLHQ